MASNKHTGMNAAAPRNIGIHPRRPRLTDLGVEVPRDSDGAFRAERRLDGKIINLRGAKSIFTTPAKQDDGTLSAFVSE